MSGITASLILPFILFLSELLAQVGCSSDLIVDQTKREKDGAVTHQGTEHLLCCVRLSAQYPSSKNEDPALLGHIGKVRENSRFGQWEQK